MRTDTTLTFNTATAGYGEHLAAFIKAREEELSGLRRLHAAVLMAAEHNPEPLPSFVSPQDEGFKRAGENAAAAEAAASDPDRVNGRPVVGSARAA